MNNQAENFLRIIKHAIHEDNSQELPQLESPVNWGILTKLAMAHNLMALFHEVAYMYPEYRESPDYEKNMQIAMMIVAQQTQKTELFLQLYREFLKEDVHPIVMKGIICRQLYGKYAEHRPSGDEDILVKKEDFYKVKSVLENNGYKCEFSEVTSIQLENAQHISFYGQDNKLLIEVHLNLLGRRSKVRAQMSEYFQHVFDDTQIQYVNNVPVSTMAHTTHFLFLTLHAFKHFTGGGVGIRQMLDILLYQEKYEEEMDWSWLVNILSDNHMIGYLGDMHYIGTNHLGIKFDVMFSHCCPMILLEDMLEVGVFGKHERADAVATNITLGALDQKQRGMCSLLRAAFPPKSHILGAAPYLNEKPWLLPIEWVKRWGRFLKSMRIYEGNLMLDGVIKSRKRMKLLRRYGL